MAVRAEIIALLEWTPWQPLQGAWLEDRLPDVPGIYRIRRSEQSTLDYIGQTGTGGMTLKKRIGMLRDIYKPLMPYRAPHTAGPALWALRQATGCDFEISAIPTEGPNPRREALKCVAISLYRQERGVSPTANFGRMPIGYRISSGNNAKLAANHQRYRGGVTDRLDGNHLPGIKPLGELAGDPVSADWCGHNWSQWMPISAVDERIAPAATGLYRIRRSTQSEWLCVGQGRVHARLEAYYRSGFPNLQQIGEVSILAECSWVLNGSWYLHQRLELENDLIASYFLHTGEVPTHQFPN